MATKKNTRKRRRRIKPIDRAEALMYAVGDYVEEHGGTVIVAGPISLMQFPEDKAHTYHIVVKCMGRKPTAPGEGTDHG